MALRPYFWIFPFVTFLIGYYVASRMWPLASVPTPSLLGLHCTQAFNVLSQAQLFPRLLEEKMDADVPAGTVIHQIPAPGTVIKPGNTVTLVISKQPPGHQAPHYIGMHKNGITKDAQRAEIRIKSYLLPSSYPAGTCIGQWPQAGSPLEEQKMTLYYASDISEPVVVPDVRGLSVSQVQEFCQRYGLQAPILRSANARELSARSSIIDQRPLPGTLMQPQAIAFHLLVTP